MRGPDLSRKSGRLGNEGAEELEASGTKCAVLGPEGSPSPRLPRLGYPLGLSQRFLEASASFSDPIDCPGHQAALGHFLPVMNIGHHLSSIPVSQTGDIFPPLPEEGKASLCGCGLGAAETHPGHHVSKDRSLPGSSLRKLHPLPSSPLTALVHSPPCECHY